MTTENQLWKPLFKNENYEVDYVFTIFQRNPVDYKIFSDIGVNIVIQ